MPVQTWAIGVDGASQVVANPERFFTCFFGDVTSVFPHEILPLDDVNVPCFVCTRVGCIGLADVPA